MIEKGAPLAHQLSWSHYVELLSINDTNKIDYYIQLCINNNLSRNYLREKIKKKEYERLDDNTKNKLINKEETNVTDFVKNPIVIKSNRNNENVSEKVLQKLILEDIDSFLKELGDGFSYIGSEYKIKLGDRYNYIDILLYNIIHNCYVVIELKVTEIKKRTYRSD